jgi:hypothetical protein
VESRRKGGLRLSHEGVVVLQFWGRIKDRVAEGTLEPLNLLAHPKDSIVRI